MGTLTIRHVDERTHARLRVRAATNGRSVEAEVRAILDAAVNRPEQNLLLSLHDAMKAKRYAADQVIDRPKIHNFAGALLGKQGDQGVFITTSRFTAGAKQEADKINARIELIDGRRLAQLLVNYGVGVQVEQQATLVRLDEDFFEDMA